MFTEFDRLAMTRALALAERGLDTTHPNPRVGCVIAKGDRIIAEGWHERAGEAHAEVAALLAAKEPVAGATAYVTLEPCSHHGRTPPCVNALIEARIGRVVFAVQDPNPRVSGQGADALLRAGITVEAGLMQAEATELNIGFMKRMREGLPWVRVKLAMSLDGRTALANGASQWITSEAARADVQRWRARCSAVMTGVGTVLADDPQLNVRVAGFKGRQPLRVVLDARLRSPVGAKMFVGLGAGAAGGGAGSAAATGGTVGGAGTTGARAGVGVASGTRPTGAATARVGGAAGATTGTVAGVPASLGGDVLIFAAVGGGLSAAGAARSAASVDPSALAGDLAELVNAFETSPTSVAARAADLVGPVSVKTEAPAPAVAPAPRAASAGTGRSGVGVSDPRAGGSGSGVDGGGPSAAAAVTGDGGGGSPAVGVSAPNAGATGPSAGATAPAARASVAASGAGVAGQGAADAGAGGSAAVNGSDPSAGATGPSIGAAAPAARASVAASGAGDAGQSAAGAGAARQGAGDMGQGAVGAGVAMQGAAGGSVPPILAAANSAAGVAVPADDATWAGAALSGAVAVKSDARAPSDGKEPSLVGSQDGRVAGTGPTTPGASAQPSSSSAAALGSIVPPAAPGVSVGRAAGGTGPGGNVAGVTVAAAPAAGGIVSGSGAVTGSAGFAGGGTAPIGATVSAPGRAGPPAGNPSSSANGAPTAATAGTPASVAAAGVAPALGAGAGATNIAATSAPGTTTAPTGAPQRGAAPARAAARPDTPAAFQARRAALLARGVRIEEVAEDDGFLDLFAVLKKLGELDVNEVLVEAGPTLAGQLLTTFFVDELLLYVAPKLLGPQGRPLVNLPELQSLQDALGFALFDAKRIGDDLRLRMRPK